MRSRRWVLQQAPLTAVVLSGCSGLTTDCNVGYVVAAAALVDCDETEGDPIVGANATIDTSRLSQAAREFVDTVVEDGEYRVCLDEADHEVTSEIEAAMPIREGFEELYLDHRGSCYQFGYRVEDELYAPFPEEDSTPAI